MTVLEFVSQPWHWAVSGIVIAATMALLLWFGKRMGVSSSWRAMCSISGAGKKISFFNYDWKQHAWQLVFSAGTIAGGFIAFNFLSSPAPVHVSQATVEFVKTMGVDAPRTMEEGAGFVPMEVFNFETLFSLKGILIFVLGGFLIGFGARWAGGCTSGHAISGLSNLQWPSLLAVVGFFIGGMLMSNWLLPYIMAL